MCSSYYCSYAGKYRIEEDESGYCQVYIEEEFVKSFPDFDSAMRFCESNQRGN